MRLASRFLTATALVASVTLMGCGKSIEPAKPQEMSLLKSKGVQTPEVLLAQKPGVYEVGIKSSNGGVELCKASVINSHYRGNQAILSDCKPDKQRDAQAIQAIKLPDELFTAELGTYSVDLQSRAGKETCLVSVINAYYGGNQVVLGGCHPQ